MSYENVVIGLEVHVQLKTNSKMFCRCSTEFGADPNANTCPVCMGLPGVLPVINERAVEFGMRAASALNCTIRDRTKFDRKNYYYPDLPKAYQISQYDMPLAEEGELQVEWEDGSQTVGVERVHMEEDAGKLIHSDVGRESYVDYNRAGTPLIEIVSHPNIEEPAAAVAYLRTLKKRMEYIGISDCNMEEGSLRCDANLSIRNEDGSLGTKTEVKNMNSFRGVRQALEYESRRQGKLIDRGGEVQQGTRLWDEDERETRPMRTKEEAHDYRYFPEPDLVPLTIDAEWIQDVESDLPEMPGVRLDRLIDEHGLSRDDAETLTGTRAMADLFEAAVEDGGSARTVANLMITDLRREMNEHTLEVEDLDLPAEYLAEVARMYEEDVVSSNGASALIEALVEEPRDPAELIEEMNLRQISDDSALEGVIEEVIEENEEAVEDVRSGKDQAVGFLVGQVMQKTEGQANPQQANEMLREAIGSKG